MRFVLGIHVGGHEAALAGERLLGRQALHVGALQQVLEVLVQIGEAGVDGYLVLPLKVLPHLTELGVRAAGRDDVIHDVNVYGIENHNVGVQRRVVYCTDVESVISKGDKRNASTLLTYVAKDDAILCGGDLHVGLDIAEIVRRQYHRMRTLHQLQIAQCGQLQRAVLQRIIWKMDRL